MATPEEIAGDLQKSNESLLASMTEMKSALAARDTLLAELKTKTDNPTVPPEIAAKIADLDSKMTEDNRRMGELQAELLSYKTEKEGLKTRLDEWERLTGQPGNTFGAGAGKRQTVGDRFIAEIEALAKAEPQRVEEALKRKGLYATRLLTVAAPDNTFEGSYGFDGIPPQRMREIQAALTTEATPNFFVQPYQLALPVPLARRRLRIADIMPQINMPAGNLIHYLRKRGFTTATYSSVASITRSGQIATVTQTAHGYSFLDIVQITDAVQAEYNGIHQITQVLDADSYTFLVSGSPATPATTLTTLHARRMNNYGAAGWVPETTLKPEAAFVYEEVEARVRTMAHVTKTSTQLLEDLPGLRADIDGDLLYGLQFKREAALLYGTNTNEQIQGIMTLPGIQNYAWSEGEPKDTRWDALRRSRTRVELTNYMPDALILHPLDFEKIETEKADDGHYLWIGGANPAGIMGLATEEAVRVNLIVTPSIQQGSWCIGPFGMTSAIYDRMQANVRFTDSNEDDFNKNLISLRAELRMAAVWKVPEAFVKGTFDHTPTP